LKENILNTVKIFALNELSLFVLPLAMLAVIRYAGTWLQNVINFGSFKWFLAPGTIIHELSHYLGDVIFGVKVDKLVVFKPQNGTLGYVSAYYNNSIRHKIARMVSAFAPVLVISPLLTGIYALMFRDNMVAIIAEYQATAGTDIVTRITSILTKIVQLPYDPKMLAIYIVIFVFIGSGLTLSRADFDVASKGFPVWIIAVLIITTIQFIPQFNPFITNWISIIATFIIITGTIEVVLVLAIGFILSTLKAVFRP
jgi:hypothetical protein